METKIKRYKGIEVEVEAITFTDEDVDKQVQSILETYPIKTSVEGPLKEGLTAVIDFEGFKDGEAFEGGKGENYELTIGSHTFIPGFEEKMEGMEKGETRNLELTFPENYNSKELAGKDVVFVVTVHDIIEKKVSELNDEFVKSLNTPEIQSVDDLVDYVKSYLDYDAERRNKQRVNDAIMATLVNNTECDVPQDKVDVAIQQQVSHLNSQLQQQNMSLTQYISMLGISMDELKGELTKAAKKQVKFETALEKIAEIEKVTVSDKELNEQYDKLAENYNMSLEDIHTHVSPNALSKDIRMMKASNIVLDSAKITFK